MAYRPSVATHLWCEWVRPFLLRRSSSWDRARRSTASSSLYPSNSARNSSSPVLRSRQWPTDRAAATIQRTCDYRVDLRFRGLDTLQISFDGDKYAHSPEEVHRTPNADRRDSVNHQPSSMPYWNTLLWTKNILGKANSPIGIGATNQTRNSLADCSITTQRQ
jgi:hypothetical protein